MFNIIKEVNYGNNEIIFAEGEEGKEVFVVLSGTVNILKEIFGVEIVVDTMLSGDVFGEMAFISGIPRTATARSVGDTTLGLVDQEMLQEEMDGFSSVWCRILDNLVLRLKKTTEECMAAREMRDDEGPDGD